MDYPRVSERRAAGLTSEPEPASLTAHPFLKSLRGPGSGELYDPQPACRESNTYALLPFFFLLNPNHSQPWCQENDCMVSQTTFTYT